MGTPKALQRPKAGSGRRPTIPGHTARRCHTYSPSGKDQKVFEEALKVAVGEQVLPERLYSSNVSFKATFHFPRPLSHFDSHGNLKVTHESPSLDVKKADLDNLVKFVLDCLQGLVIKDDFQVTSLQADKRWSNSCEPKSPGSRDFVGVGSVEILVELHVS